MQSVDTRKEGSKGRYIGIKSIHKGTKVEGAQGKYMELRYNVLEKTKATYIGNKEGKRGIRARYKEKKV